MEKPFVKEMVEAVTQGVAETLLDKHIRKQNNKKSRADTTRDEDHKKDVPKQRFRSLS